MSKPKYLPIPKKIPYNIRLPKHLLDSLNAYAELTGNTTTDVVIGALNDFIKDKTVYNDYLANVNGISIKLPMVSDEKAEFYNANLIGENSATELFQEISGYNATTVAYEILKIPNNLDVFNNEFGYVTPDERIAAKGKHSGIEFAVIPDFYNYNYGNNDDIIGALYCLYFEIEMDKVKEITIIDYMDAINKANDVGNVTLKNNIVSCVNDLKKLEIEINDGGFDGVEFVESGVDAVTDSIINKLEKIAKTYNTGNVIKLGENIDAAIVTAEINEHPELYDVFMDDVMENTKKYVNDAIGDIADLVKNAKSKDEILTAIDDIKIKTNKD